MPSALVLAAVLAATASPATPIPPSAQTPFEPAAPALPELEHPAAREPVHDPADPSAAKLALPDKDRRPAEKTGGGAAARGTASARSPEKAAADAPASSRTLTTTPPSLTARALLDELRHAAHERQGEQSSISEQRRKLEDLQRAMEKSRAELREETSRLQSAVAAGGARGGSKPGRKGSEDALDALARTTRSMKAEPAAAMGARLDRGLAAAILGRMRPADAALVLEKMEPATSASLVALLAGRDRT
jgi:flagellar motility protein MotE (MotC chaperone)